jgi:hypothetical protein
MRCTALFFGIYRLSVVAARPIENISYFSFVLPGSAGLTILDCLFPSLQSEGAAVRRPATAQREIKPTIARTRSTRQHEFADQHAHLSAGYALHSPSAPMVVQPLSRREMSARREFAPAFR